MKLLIAGGLLLVILLMSGCCGAIPSESTYYKSENSSSQGQALPTPQPDLDAKIVGCNTNFGFGGETTTVFVTVTNNGTGAADDVSVTFDASDSEEGQKTLTLGRFPASKQRTISYAINTKFGEQTTVEIAVNAKNMYTINDFSADCRKMDDATLQNLNTLVQLGLQAV